MTVAEGSVCDCDCEGGVPVPAGRDGVFGGGEESCSCGRGGGPASSVADSIHQMFGWVFRGGPVIGTETVSAILGLEVPLTWSGEDWGEGPCGEVTIIEVNRHLKQGGRGNCKRCRDGWASVGRDRLTSGYGCEFK